STRSEPASGPASGNRWSACTRPAPRPTPSPAHRSVAPTGGELEPSREPPSTRDGGKGACPSNPRLRGPRRPSKCRNEIYRTQAAVMNKRGGSVGYYPYPPFFSSPAGSGSGEAVG